MASSTLTDGALFVQKGVEKAKAAIQADRAANSAKALELYTAAIEYLIQGIKFERTEAVRKVLTTKVEGYLVRAEELKAILKPASTTTTATTGGGGGGGGSSK